MKRPEHLASTVFVRPRPKIVFERLDRPAPNGDVGRPVSEGCPRPDIVHGLIDRAIRFRGRRYTSPAVQDFSASIEKPTRVTIEVDPDDPTSIRAKLDGKWHRVPSVTEYAELRTPYARSAKYRHDRLSAPADEER